jgi:hypothetical protein
MINRMSWMSIAVVTLLLSALSGAQSAASQDGLMPTEALHLANVALANGDRARQQEIVSPFLGKARKSALSPEEEMALGELYFLALDPRNSDAIFSKYLDRSDMVGRMAWIRHQQIQFRAFDRHDQTEADLPGFRSRFPVSPDDLTYTAMMVSNQAGRYAAAGNHAKAAELVLDDVKRLPLDLPMRSFRLLGTYFKSLLEAGKGPEARALLEAHRARLQEVVTAAGAQLEPASVVKQRAVAHRASLLHADWDTANADDDPGFSRARFNAQLALDRIRELDSMLAGTSPGR